MKHKERGGETEKERRPVTTVGPRGLVLLENSGNSVVQEPQISASPGGSWGKPQPPLSWLSVWGAWGLPCHGRVQFALMAREALGKGMPMQAGRGEASLLRNST